MKVRLALMVALVLSAIAACGEDAGGGGGGGAAGTAAAPGGGGASAGAGGAAGAGGNSTGGTAGSDASAGTGGASGGGGAAGALEDASTDGGIPLPGLGALAGDCGPIDAVELTSPSPFTFETVLDFGTTPYSYAALSTGGKKIFDDGNLGGSSIYSEIFSFEVLHRCELASLLKTETEIAYSDASGKRTDLLVQIDGYKVGVSVTRAFAYPPGTPLSVADAQTLLDKKLSDILLSTLAVDPTDAWTKQILHVLAYDNQARDALMQAYALVPAATRADTILMITVTNGSDSFLY